MPKKPNSADELRAINEELGLSQEDFAKAIDVPLRTYSRWLSGGSRVRADALIAAYRLRDAAKKRAIGKKRGA